MAGPIANIGQAALSVVADPYLPRVTQLVLEMRDVEASTSGPSQMPGIGLRHAVLPLEIFVKIRKHPIISALVAIGVIGGIYYAGYSSGKSK